MTSSSPPIRHDPGTGSLLVDVIGDVAVVTFNNPRRHNALSGEMRAALPAVLGALQADSAVHAVVLTGAGDKAFISGADISEFAERRTTPAARAEYDRGWAALNLSWQSLQKPVIAMIRGFCLGAGLLIALQADIRIASADSQFGIPAARPPAAPAGHLRLTTARGSARARRRRAARAAGSGRRPGGPARRRPAPIPPWAAGRARAAG